MEPGILLAKLTFAGIFALVLVFVVRPAVEVIGIVTCPGCNPFINTFMFVIVPMAAIFIGIYHVVSIFGTTGGRR